jgi:hypothetical protein
VDLTDFHPGPREAQRPQELASGSPALDGPREVQVRDQRAQSVATFVEGAAVDHDSYVGVVARTGAEPPVDEQILGLIVRLRYTLREPSPTRFCEQAKRLSVKFESFSRRDGCGAGNHGVAQRLQRVSKVQASGRSPAELPRRRRPHAERIERISLRRHYSNPEVRPAIEELHRHLR